MPGTIRIHLLLFISLLGILFSTPLQSEETKPEVFAHYMPWFANQSTSGKWGYHWTMNHFDPDIVKWNGRRELAAHDTPLLGLYDSSDPDLQTCHALLIKYAGLDGAIIDWYGTKDFYDYGQLHQNTIGFIAALKKAGLKYAVCYEDQSIGGMVKAGKLNENQAVEHGKEVLKWVEDNWFRDEAYAKLDGQPILPIFGPQHFNQEKWDGIIASLKTTPKTFGLPHLTKGAQLAWPPVTSGKTTSSQQWKASLGKLYSSDRGALGVAFPGFHDIYEKAGLHQSYGRIDARDGATLDESIELALEHKLPLIQIATWNDFGEGTQIEPTHNLGYRYLESIQTKLHQSQTYSKADLRLPVAFYHLKKRAEAINLDLSASFTELTDALFASETKKAKSLLAEIKKTIESEPIEAGSKYRLIENISYRSNTDADDYQKNRCKLDLYYPGGGSKPYSTVIWFHGGGISKGNKEIPTPLLEKGVAVASVNYRLNPYVTEPAYLEDAAAATAWVMKNIHRYGAGKPDRVFVSGHSAGGYLASMIGLDKPYLAAFDIDANDLAGLIPFSGHTITHFTVRKERGISGMQPIIDPMAPLFHIRKDCPPMLLITGDREMELWGRYEENAYFWRMMQVIKHPDTTLRELEGYDHGSMPEPAFPLLLDFVRKRE